MSKRSYKSYNRKRLETEDDLVIVFRDDSEIYRGEDDYEPMRDENWKWDNSIQAYKLEDSRTEGHAYIKICLDI